MIRKDNKSVTEMLDERFAAMGEGMSTEEKAALLRGYAAGLDSIKNDLPALALKHPNLGEALLGGVEAAIKSSGFQLVFAQHQATGDSESWLEEQLSIGIRQMADVALGRPLSVTNPQTRSLDA